MRLDSRIIGGKKFLDCFDTDTATEFVGEKCYFGKDNTDFEDISKLPCSMLYSVDNSSAPYDYYKEGILHSVGFVLPCAWVKKLEPRYRPYRNVQELFHDIGCSVGDVIDYRRKSDSTRYRSVIAGTSHTEKGDELVFFVNGYYTLKELFKLCEVWESGEWRPFGIKDVYEVKK